MSENDNLRKHFADCQKANGLWSIKCRNLVARIEAQDRTIADLLEKLTSARAFIDRRLAAIQADPNGHPLDAYAAQLALDRIDSALSE